MPVRFPAVPRLRLPFSAAASRRDVLRGLAGVAVATAGAAPTARAAPGLDPRAVRIEDDALSLSFDRQMRCRVVSRLAARPLPLTGWDASDGVVRADGTVVDRFLLGASRVEAAGAGPHGPSRTLHLDGRAAGGLVRHTAVTVHARFPGLAVIETSYRNDGDRPLELKGWFASRHRLLARAARGAHEAFWSFAGSSHEDRHDWVQPVAPGFSQANFMGMNAVDYGGGTPVVDVWRRDAGLAVGHLTGVPLAVSLPVRWSRGGVELGVRRDLVATLAPGAVLETGPVFVAVHRGDHFASLDAYRRLMAERGIAAATPPAAAFESIWCAWGYEREFSIERVVATLPKVRELGLSWAVLDDGWQRRVGDWTPDPGRFPRGDDDMKAFVGRIKAHGLKPRLWIAPLAVAPGSDELHDHTSMLLLDKDGAVQNVSWWNSFYLCPACDETLERTRAVVRRIIGDWGFEGLKVDGQHLNGVAPCFNPAHRHARPEESSERLPQFFRAIRETAHAINPEAVVELCPCGTSFAFHNVPYVDQTPASDPLSSWQVRLKGKTLKALMGPSAAYAGDHVELSDGGQDFASTVGVGGIVSTKFTWPVDPKPKDSFLLTPEREAHWRRWIDAWRRHALPTGTYRGTLYDIGFDRPETHVVEKGARMYYAFHAAEWDGPVELRGLRAGRHEVREVLDDALIGHVEGVGARVTLAFKGARLVYAVPMG
jgi:alpha-galactosidase